jgi:hypothetical protein
VYTPVCRFAARAFEADLDAVSRRTAIFAQSNGIETMNFRARLFSTRCLGVRAAKSERMISELMAQFLVCVHNYWHKSFQWNDEN